MTTLLLISLTACASAPSKDSWGEALRFHWRADLNRWEIATVGLQQFHQQCRFEPSDGDDAVLEQAGQSYITPAYYAALLRSCKAHEKAA